MARNSTADNLINSFLSLADQICQRLESAGIDAPHRHDLVALLANGQVRLDGELQSLEARYAKLKVQSTKILDTSEKLVQSAAGIVFFPGIYVMNRLRGKK